MFYTSGFITTTEDANTNTTNSTRNDTGRYVYLFHLFDIPGLLHPLFIAGHGNFLGVLQLLGGYGSSQYESCTLTWTKVRRQ